MVLCKSHPLGLLFSQYVHIWLFLSLFIRMQPETTRNVYAVLQNRKNVFFHVKMTCLNILYTWCMSLTHLKLLIFIWTSFNHSPLKMAKKEKKKEIMILHQQSHSKGNQQTNWKLNVWYSSSYKEIWRIRWGQGQKGLGPFEKMSKSETRFPQCLFDKSKNVQQGPGLASGSFIRC